MSCSYQVKNDIISHEIPYISLLPLSRIQLLLKTLSAHYKIIVFTTSVFLYVKTIVDHLDTDMIHIKGLKILEERKTSYIHNVR